jgi:hypothetical protein
VREDHRRWAAVGEERNEKHTRFVRRRGCRRIDRNGHPAMATVYDWSYSDPAGDTGSGTLTVTGATSPFTMTDITGTYNGSSINTPGVLPPGTCCGVPANDNLVFVPPSPNFLDQSGIGFSTASLPAVNLFFDESVPSYAALNGNLADENADGTFTLTTATIPEPSTWAMMLLGFGLLGGAGYWKRRRSVAIAG